MIKTFEEMVKLFDEFNKLTSYDQEEINISSFFIHHPISYRQHSTIDLEGMFPACIHIR